MMAVLFFSLVVRSCLGFHFEFWWLWFGFCFAPFGAGLVVALLVALRAFRCAPTGLLASYFSLLAQSKGNQKKVRYQSKPNRLFGLRLSMLAHPVQH
jgi:hypothetical protein